jgi:hypothetical protein
MVTICAWCGALLRIHRDYVRNLLRYDICAVCRDDREEVDQSYATLWIDIGGEGGGA